MQLTKSKCAKCTSSQTTETAQQTQIENGGMWNESRDRKRQPLSFSYLFIYSTWHWMPKGFCVTAFHSHHLCVFSSQSHCFVTTRKQPKDVEGFCMSIRVVIERKISPGIKMRWKAQLSGVIYQRLIEVTFLKKCFIFWSTLVFTF